MRTFVSINIEDQDLIRRIRELAFKIKDEEDGINVTKEENLHFTLKFLGEINEEQLKVLIKNMSEISFPAFSIDIKDLGVFPNLSNIRIIWIGAKSNEITELAKVVDERSSFIKSEESFVPHLTIARVKYVRNKAELIKRIQNFARVDFGKYKVEKFYLMESKLYPSGPVYTPIKEFKLA